MGPSGFVKFNNLISSLAGPSARARDEQLLEIGKSGKMSIIYERAVRSAAMAMKMAVALRPLTICLLGAWTLALLQFAAAAESINFTRDIFQAGLTARGIKSQITETTRSVKDVRELVAKKLNSRLLTRLRNAAGSDFKIEPVEDPHALHAGVLVLSYADDKTAQRMNQLLFSRHGYFADSTILIRFAAVLAGKSLVVAYSESSGDDRIIAVLNSFPEQLLKASAGERP
jgi:hypothetical protein